MTVQTGRTQSDGHRPLICQSCEARITFGNPNIDSTWFNQLRLSRDQLNLLLLAAAEFHAMTRDEAGPRDDGCPTPIEFVDWISVDVLQQGPRNWPTSDGSAPRNDGAARSYRHRHPDPLPVASLRSLKL